MNNAQINKGFILSSSATLRNSILDNIANHYGVTREVIYQELTTGTPGGHYGVCNGRPSGGSLYVQSI